MYSVFVVVVVVVLGFFFFLPVIRMLLSIINEFIFIEHLLCTNSVSRKYNDE